MSKIDTKEVPVELHYIEKNGDMVSANKMFVFLFMDLEGDRIGIRSPDGFSEGHYFISLKELTRFLEGRGV